jgi:butyrate kinase
LSFKILVINPGSTSTKVALYENESEKFVQNIEHSFREICQYNSVIDQYPLRKEAVLSFLNKNKIKLTELSCVIGRGGLLPPMRSGAYLVNEEMVETLSKRPVGEHVSNLGGVIAYEIARPLGIPAYIYDAISVDEMEPVAKITGLPEIKRVSFTHALNMRAAALRTAAMYGISYYKSTFIVAHLGGGISLSVHDKGKMVDIVSDDEGPMSPERAGRIPGLQLIQLCYSGKLDKKAVSKKLRGNGGLIAHLGTNKALEIEERIKNGDKDAELIYFAMAYQIAKSIGELSTVVKGKVDKIILTGGIAHSHTITGWIKERVGFIAPVQIVPGENEMESLALGALRVLNGEEQARNFCLEADRLMIGQTV